MIDRYLCSVRQYLPAAQQDDLIGELAENVRSQREEREAELGRSLTDAEVAAMLKQPGHAMLMAGRYLPHRHLIGPAVFPYYWFTLKRVLWLTLVLLIIAGCTTPFVASILPATSHVGVPELLRSPGAGLVVWGTMAVLFAVFGIVTLLFALVDLFPTRYHLIERWDPRRLAPVPKLPAEFLGRPIPRPQLIAGLLVAAVFTVCWLLMPRFPIILGPGAGAILQPGAGWQALRLVLLGLVLVGMVRSAVALWRSPWLRWLGPMIHLRVAGLVWM